MNSLLRWTAAVLAISALGACAHYVPASDAYAGTPSPAPAWGSAEPQRSGYGIVTRIEAARAPAVASNPGAGAVLGGAIGAVIGRQVGGSSDARSAATLVGAVVGAIAGHHLEKGQRGDERVRITVQLDNGQAVTVETEANSDLRDLRIGERVRVDNNRVLRVAQHRGADLQSPLS